MAKYRMCGGLAMMPVHDMALLKRMSSKGWHLSGFSGAVLYRFEQGEPHEYDYEVYFEPGFAPEVQELFRAGGWEPVALGPGWQIVRAEAGTTPLFTDDESKIEVLSRSRGRMGGAALTCALLAAAFFGLENLFVAQQFELGETICLMGLGVALACLVFSFLPFIGFTFSLRKLRAGR